MSLNNEWIEQRKKVIFGRTPESIAKCFVDETPTSSTFVDCRGCLWLVINNDKCNYCALYEILLPDEIIPLGCGNGEADIPF